ncbi:MAG TPA: hypothetical protein VF261_02955 [Candidatus Saccharimonadales bacterium]
MNQRQFYKDKLWPALKWPLRQLVRYWRGGWWRKTLTVAAAVILLTLGTMYGIARWYIWSERNQPLTMGVSFVPDYASYLGLSPQKTMDALIGQLHVKQFRLTSYWNDIETSPGHYDFSQLDWEFAKADAAHAKIILVVGLRQPRWPECHAPSFYDTSKPESQWYPQLKAFMTAVINRYKHSPALQGYQLENEYFLKQYGFYGACHDFSRSRLVDEYNLVQRLDPQHPIIVGRSNNDLGWPIGAPTPSKYSVSVYRRVWDATLTHRYLEYPFPAWYYAFLAGWQKIFTGRDMIIGEMQAEPWPPNGQGIPDTSLAEQNKSFNAARLKSAAAFAKGTGMKTIDFWGAEYWYYRDVVLHDPSVWNTAKQLFN